MTRAVKTFTFVLPLLLATACTNPAADQPRAVTNQAAPVASAPAGGEKYSITPENSKIEFVGSKVTGSHNGSFGKFSGAIDYLGQPEKSRVKITIDLDSLTADDPITFPATIAVNPGAITVDSTFSINRKDFGINYAGASDNLIRDEVVLTLRVRGVKS